MQTPISFALEILLDCEKIEDAHKKCRKYIKLLEAKEVQSHRPQIMHAPFASTQSAQATSTQRLLEQHGIPQPAAAPTAAPVINRVVGGEVSTGNGTRGPRKY